MARKFTVMIPILYQYGAMSMLLTDAVKIIKTADIKNDGNKDLYIVAYLKEITRHTTNIDICTQMMETIEYPMVTA